MERGASWSQQLDGNFAKRTPAFVDVSGLHGHQTLPSLYYGMLILKCTRVLLYVLQ